MSQFHYPISSSNPTKNPFLIHTSSPHLNNHLTFLAFHRRICQTRPILRSNIRIRPIHTTPSRDTQGTKIIPNEEGNGRQFRDDPIMAPHLPRHLPAHIGNQEKDTVLCVVAGHAAVFFRGQRLGFELCFPRVRGWMVTFVDFRIAEGGDGEESGVRFRCC